jgi:uncharacterized membrane protein
MVALASYNAYLLLHVVAAVVWLGGGLTLSVLGARIARQHDPVRMAAFARDVEWMGTRVFIPASLLVLLFGFVMIHEGPASFDQLWIQVALGLFGVTFLTGALFLGPQAGKIAKLVEELGVAAPAVQEQIRRVLFVARLDLLTLYSIVVLMVAKPTADEALLYTIWGIVLAAAVTVVTADHLRRGAEDRVVPAGSE